MQEYAANSHHTTLYKPFTKAFSPVPDPSQSLSHAKLSGFSYSSRTWMPFTPARHKIPDTEIRMNTRSLKIPRVFCKRRPNFKRVPWMRHIEVRQLKATSRVLNHVGSIDKECSRSEILINYPIYVERSEGAYIHWKRYCSPLQSPVRDGWTFEILQYSDSLPLWGYT